MKKITVKCGVCDAVLIVAKGELLDQDAADNYKLCTSCNDSEHNDIQVLLEEI